MTPREQEQWSRSDGETTSTGGRDAVLSRGSDTIAGWKTRPRGRIAALAGHPYPSGVCAPMTSVGQASRRRRIAMFRRRRNRRKNLFIVGPLARPPSSSIMLATIPSVTTRASARAPGRVGSCSVHCGAEKARCEQFVFPGAAHSRAADNGRDAAPYAGVQRPGDRCWTARDSSPTNSENTTAPYDSSRFCSLLPRTSRDAGDTGAKQNWQSKLEL
jgi:hypothetical protein